MQLLREGSVSIVDDDPVACSARIVRIAPASTRTAVWNIVAHAEHRAGVGSNYCGAPRYDCEVPSMPFVPPHVTAHAGRPANPNRGSRLERQIASGHCGGGDRYGRALRGEDE